ncbi:serine/threonine protein kinase [Saccharothrix sp. S26]|uniref:serine/threonine-protein kinase n=1 Tax=Saccharothrix sp. S26 TaxID=2907215 RepID=UPI001F3958FE|nr:serine/threonine-protein kinase [Saccharothrix sp. S26]MCE7000759.1 serine/threonine protein kinase [Saccharothrix sp. S26]
MDVGRLVAGRYRLRGRVGAGAMGVVWQALDERLDRVVALKQLVVPEGSDPVAAVGRAAREARIAARLRHPNAVTVHDVVEDDGRPVLVMEYLAARTLADRIARGPLPAEQVTGIGAQVASALAAAHAAGIVHRDVKPGNVLLTEDGTAKITDFGIARAVGDVTVTRTGLLAGTPAYLSPEVARGGEPGPASDVFALGATLYAAVEGRPPFGEGDNAIALLHAVAAGRFPPPTRAGPLTAVLVDLLRTDPATRPTMAQAAERLRAPSTAIPAATRLDLNPADLPPPTGPHPVDVPPTGPPPTNPPPAGPPTPAPRLPLQGRAAPTAVAPHPTALGAHPARRGRAGLLAVAAAAVVGLVVTVLVVSNGSRTATTATGAVTSTPPAGSTPSPAQLEQAVAEYYALVPKNLAQAWERLGPGLQAQGRQQFEKSWREVKDLVVSSPPAAAGPDTVTIGIDFSGPQGKRVRETHRLRLVVRGGTPLIDADEVLSSQRLDKGHPGEKDHEEDDKKEDRKRGGGKSGEG